MKYLLLFVSIQAFACKPTISNSKDVSCEQCAYEYGACMTSSFDQPLWTEIELRQYRNDCQNQLKVCFIKNKCQNKG